MLLSYNWWSGEYMSSSTPARTFGLDVDSIINGSDIDRRIC